MANEARDLLPLSPRSFYVLLVLAQGEAHGYAIARTVEEVTDGTVRLTAGTLYPLIRQMLDNGWIAEISGPDDDPRRRSYRLTARGRRIAEAEAARLATVVRMARTCKLLPAGSV
jgi:DNA-binding PadR family transcriptional regulator